MRRSSLGLAVTPRRCTTRRSTSIAVGGHDALGLGTEELGPAGSGSPWRWRKPITSKDVGDAALVERPVRALRVEDHGEADAPSVWRSPSSPAARPAGRWRRRPQAGTPEQKVLVKRPDPRSSRVSYVGKSPLRREPLLSFGGSLHCLGQAVRIGARIRVQGMSPNPDRSVSRSHGPAKGIMARQGLPSCT
jgi:hypothetical protein